MIYQYTGQPGHGKTLHAIDHLLKFKDEGRLVYACNIRDFDYHKTGVLEMTPADFCNWMEFLPDGAVALVDECYEHGMLPKRPNSTKVPEHVEQLAKHRHRGIDFIFVCQSPDKQCDVFVHDLIERHIHVRRRFGTSFVQLRIFDRFEANAEKAVPLVNKRVRLPKRPMGTYKSTELDTTQRNIPWYYIALWVGLPALGIYAWWTWDTLMAKFGQGEQPPPTITAQQPATEAGGAPATTADARRPPSTLEEYVERFRPLIASQPWTAPAYADVLQLPPDPPRVYCVIGLAGLDGQGEFKEAGCRCHTEQGTRYAMERTSCEVIAIQGQYEPFRRAPLEGIARTDSVTQSRGYMADADLQRRTANGTGQPFGSFTGYGDYGIETGRYIGQGISSGR